MENRMPFVRLFVPNGAMKNISQNARSLMRLFESDLLIWLFNFH